MELLKDEQITLNIDGFVISQNLHNKATATSLFGITDKDNLNIGHDDRTWVLEKDIICDTCNNCVSCQTCNSCNGCVSTVGCQDRCQGCTGSCTGCANDCYETCFGDCYTCQDCQTGCTSCNACTAGCDGGCQTECYACVSCDDCVGCNGDCVGCFGGCQENCQTCTGCASCTACVSCQTGCQTGCFDTCAGCVDTSYHGGCTSKCQSKCQTCTGCDNNCYKGCTSCDGCTSGCQTGCQTGCQICTAGCQTCVSCNGCTSCNGCVDCVGCTGCVSCTSCDSCTLCTDGCYSGCDGGCQGGCYSDTVCGICTGGCQTGCQGSCQGGCQGSCQAGCTTGNYCYSNQCGSNTGPALPEVEQKKETVDLYCVDINGGGIRKGTVTGCKSPPYDGAKSTAPKAWLKSGKTQKQWDEANKREKLEFCQANNILVKIKDPRGQNGKDFIGAELSELQKMNPNIDHVDYEYDEKTRQNIGVAYDKDGNKLLNLKETAAGEFEVSSTDGKKAGTTKINTDTGKTEKPLNVHKTNDDGSEESYDDEEGNTYTGPDGKKVPVDTNNKGAGC